MKLSETKRYVLVGEGSNELIGFDENGLLYYPSVLSEVWFFRTLGDAKIQRKRFPEVKLTIKHVQLLDIDV